METLFSILLASMGWADVVKYLLERKSVNINARNKDGQMALHLAAKYREAEITRLLIAHQAILDVKDKDGRTSLQRAAEFGSKPVPIAPVESGSDPTKKTGQPPIGQHHGVGKTL